MTKDKPPLMPIPALSRSSLGTKACGGARVEWVEGLMARPGTLHGKEQPRRPPTPISPTHSSPQYAAVLSTQGLNPGAGGRTTRKEPWFQLNPRRWTPLGANLNQMKAHGMLYDSARHVIPDLPSATLILPSLGMSMIGLPAWKIRFIQMTSAAQAPTPRHGPHAQEPSAVGFSRAPS